jgi:hypothetical protein
MLACSLDQSANRLSSLGQMDIKSFLEMLHPWAEAISGWRIGLNCFVFNHVNLLGLSFKQKFSFFNRVKMSNVL